MRVSSVLATGASAAVLASGLVLAAPAQGSEAAGCSVSVPARVYISKPEYKMTATSTCARAGAVHAQWDAHGPTGAWWNDAAFDNGASTIGVQMYDNYTPIGRTQWRAAGAHDDQTQPIVQNNNPYTWFKLASWSALTTSRSGATVKANLRVLRYSSYSREYIPYAKKYVVLQFQGRDGAWYNLKALTTNTSGKVSYSFNYSAARSYRIYITPTTQIWESASAASRR